MALILRIDVDRPYGKHPQYRHILSRVSSDFYFPKVDALGYLRELKQMLRILNHRQARSYVFFRCCTLPSDAVMELLQLGRHEIGLHLENSRSWLGFAREKQLLERHIGKPVVAVSKHGSGKSKYGLHHYAPYEPERYVQWAEEAGMRVFLGNLEDPTLPAAKSNGNLVIHPAAFWLEPHWRDTSRFSVDWLLREALNRDVVLLVHPENVLESPVLASDFQRIVSSVETRVFSA